MNVFEQVELKKLQRFQQLHASKLNVYLSMLGESEKQNHFELERLMDSVTFNEKDLQLIVFGSEGSGIDQKYFRLDNVKTFEIASHALTHNRQLLDSLNVASASAVTLNAFANVKKI